MIASLPLHVSSLRVDCSDFSIMRANRQLGLALFVWLFKIRITRESTNLCVPRTFHFQLNEKGADELLAQWSWSHKVGSQKPGIYRDLYYKISNVNSTLAKNYQTATVLQLIFQSFSRDAGLFRFTCAHTAHNVDGRKPSSTSLGCVSYCTRLCFSSNK